VPFRLPRVEAEGSVPQSIFLREEHAGCAPDNLATRKTSKRAETFLKGLRACLHLLPKSVPTAIRWSFDSFAFLTLVQGAATTELLTNPATLLLLLLVTAP